MSLESITGGREYDASTKEQVLSGINDVQTNVSGSSAEMIPDGAGRPSVQFVG